MTCYHARFLKVHAWECDLYFCVTLDEQITEHALFMQHFVLPTKRGLILSENMLQFSLYTLMVILKSPTPGLCPCVVSIGIPGIESLYTRTIIFTCNLTPKMVNMGGSRTR